jgi:hypothetical protein
MQICVSITELRSICGLKTDDVTRGWKKLDNGDTNKKDGIGMVRRMRGEIINV